MIHHKQRDEALRATRHELIQRVGKRKAAFVVVIPDEYPRGIRAMKLIGARRELRAFVKENASSRDDA